jgi:hypothetical protein
MFDWLRRKLQRTPFFRPAASGGPPAQPEKRQLSTWALAQMQGPIAWGQWVLLQMPWEHPEHFLGYVYVDPGKGLSAKGDRESVPVAELAERPGVTVRLPMGFPVRPLTAEEVSARGLPTPPPWLALYGPQPDPESTWRKDPYLKDRFHECHPEDLQVMVHDGELRRTGVTPEMCWVRVLRAEPGPSRRALYSPGHTQLSQEEFAQRYSGDTWVYVGRMLNAPQQLHSVRQGEEIRFITGARLLYPLYVTPLYLQEREHWRIAPCNQCGTSEAFDPPSIMARFRFPDLPPGTEVKSFTAFCPMCDGVQLFSRVDAGN